MILAWASPFNYTYVSTKCNTAYGYEKIYVELSHIPPKVYDSILFKRHEKWFKRMLCETQGVAQNNCLKLHNCFAYFIQNINPWRMVFYFLILLPRLLSY